MSLMATALVLAWVAIALLTLSVAGLMRQVHLLLTERAADGTPVPAAERAPALPAGLLAGDRDGVVVFASASCVACSQIMPVLVEHCAAAGRSCTVVTPAERHPRWPDGLTYREHAADLFERFGVVATPHALRVVDGAVVDAAPVGSIAALERLLAGPQRAAEVGS